MIFLGLIISSLMVLEVLCVIIPNTYKKGFFALRKKNKKELLIQNLIAHYIFMFDYMTAIF